MALLTHEILHLIIGAILAFLLTVRGKWSAILPWVLISSLLTDLDHIIDYLERIGLRWDPVAFQTGSYFENRALILLHSWELAAILVILGLLTNGGKYSVPLLGLGAGLFGHLLLDQFWYMHPWGHLFLSLRLLHGFNSAHTW